MLLENRIAVVYGGAGFVGRSVAQAFAREGASVFLAGRSRDRLDRAAAAIAAEGGMVEAAQVDARDETQVEHHAGDVVARAGRIDVWFNALAYGDVQGAPLAELANEHVLEPVTTALQAHLTTVRAAARRMVPQGSGAILTVTGYGPPYPTLGGTGVAWQAVEALYRQWACELGPSGIRVAWLRTGGFRESILGAAEYTDPQMLVDGALTPLADQVTPESAEQEVRSLAEQTMLRRLPSLADAGAAAAFLASERAGAITATAVNLTAGAVAD